jgi:hypothetical protein
MHRTICAARPEYLNKGLGLSAKTQDETVSEVILVDTERLQGGNIMKFPSEANR